MVVRADAKQGQKGMKKIIEIGMVVEAVQVLTEVDLVVVVVVVVAVVVVGRLSKHGNVSTNHTSKMLYMEAKERDTTLVIFCMDLLKVCL